VVLETSPAQARKQPPPGTRRKLKIFAAVAFVALVAAGAIWLTWPQPEAPELVTGDARPSIVVLPFDNLSGDREEDYFSDGMTEDLITDLSHVSGLFVIARNTSFTFKGRAVSVKDIGQELGVRYVLEGSVRRAGNRVRINAQLIEADTEYHVWSDRFDREMTDVFALQDEVVQRIVSALAVKLTRAELERFSGQQETSPEAYDLVLRGIEQLRLFTKETNREARRFFLEATRFDPQYARAWANIAFTYSIESPFGWTDDPDESMRLAIEYANKANALDDGIVQVHFALSNIYVRQQRYDEAIAEANRSVELDPNYSDGYGALTLALLNAGRYDEALSAIRTALRLDPRGPFFYHWLEGRCLFMKGRYEEAREKFELVAERNPGFVAGLKYLAATYAMLGRIDDAEWTGDEILVLQPGYTLTREREAGFTADSASAEGDERFISALRLAGIPE
jgi:adenylate cyclase